MVQPMDVAHCEIIVEHDNTWSYAAEPSAEVS